MLKQRTQAGSDDILIDSKLDKFYLIVSNKIQIIFFVSLVTYCKSRVHPMYISGGSEIGEMPALQVTDLKAGVSNATAIADILRGPPL